MSVKAVSKDSLQLFAREFAPAATSMASGTLGLVGGRPSPTPVVRLFSFLLPKAALSVGVDGNGQRWACRCQVTGTRAVSMRTLSGRRCDTQARRPTSPRDAFP